MQKYVRQWGCIAAVVVWLGLMICPIFVCVLIRNGQIEWGNDPQNQMRLFLVQERGQEGVGFQWTRPANDDASCIYTTVRYPIMFEGEAENSSSCQCIQEVALQTEIPATCELPESQP